MSAARESKAMTAALRAAVLDALKESPQQWEHYRRARPGRLSGCRLPSGLGVMLFSLIALWRTAHPLVTLLLGWNLLASAALFGRALQIKGALEAARERMTALPVTHAQLVELVLDDQRSHGRWWTGCFLLLAIGGWAAEAAAAGSLFEHLDAGRLGFWLLLGGLQALLLHVGSLFVLRWVGDGAWCGACLYGLLLILVLAGLVGGAGVTNVVSEQVRDTPWLAMLSPAGWVQRGMFGVAAAQPLGVLGFLPLVALAVLHPYTLVQLSSQPWAGPSVDGEEDEEDEEDELAEEEGAEARAHAPERSESAGADAPVDASRVEDEEAERTREEPGEGADASAPPSTAEPEEAAVEDLADLSRLVPGSEEQALEQVRSATWFHLDWASDDERGWVDRSLSTLFDAREQLVYRTLKPDPKFTLYWGFGLAGPLVSILLALVYPPIANFYLVLCWLTGLLALPLPSSDLWPGLALSRVSGGWIPRYAFLPLAHRELRSVLLRVGFLRSALFAVPAVFLFTLLFTLRRADPIGGLSLALHVSAIAFGLLPTLIGMQLTSVLEARGWRLLRIPRALLWVAGAGVGSYLFFAYPSPTFRFGVSGLEFDPGSVWSGVGLVLVWLSGWLGWWLPGILYARQDLLRTKPPSG